MSRVTSSLPSLVSRAMHSNSSMWTEVNTSCLATRSLIKIESSKLKPCQGMNATITLRPRAISPMSQAGPSASTSPVVTISPGRTIGFWL
jgi:hypothetical protein